MIIDSYKYVTAPAGLGYGYLYNWYAASNVNFAPSAMRVPVKADFDVLKATETPINYNRFKEVGTERWNTANGTNLTNFTWVGSGNRQTDGIFAQLKERGYLWASDQSGVNPAYANFNDLTAFSVSYLSELAKKVGQSIRLVSDINPGSTVTDNDGNVYDVVLIGAQYWTVQNWKCTTLDDGTPLVNATLAATWAAATATDYYYCAYDNDEGNV